MKLENELKGLQSKVNSCLADNRGTHPTNYGERLDDMQKNLNTRYNLLNDTIKTLKTLKTTDKRDVQPMDVTTDMINQIDMHATQIKLMEDRIESLKVNDRDDVIIIDGVVPEANKSLAQSVCNQLNKHMDLKLELTEFVQCNFIGKSEVTPPGNGEAVPSEVQDSQNEVKPRSIRAKMFDKRTKKLMLKRKGQLRKSKIYLKEHLTVNNNKIFYFARQARDYELIEHVWTDNGRVWVIVKEGEQPMLLTDLDFIEGLVNDAIAGGAIKRDKTAQPRLPRKPRAGRQFDDSSIIPGVIYAQ